MKQLILIMLLCISSVCMADTKTTALVELTAVVDGDILYIVDDPGGSPLSKKITVLNLFDTIDTSLKLLTILTNETGTGFAVFATTPTFTTSILAAGQADIGSTAAEFGDIFIGDGKAIKFGDDQDVTLTHTADTKLTLNLEFEVDGTLDADGIVELGDGGDNFSVASDGIDIDTSGNITNAGTIASGVITVTGLINTSVGLDAVGAVDLDYGSVDVTDHTFTSDGGTTIIDGSITAIGEDLGSTTAEWNDVFLNDGGIINLGNDQDVTITHVADTGILVNLGIEVDGLLNADGIVTLGDGGDNFSVASDGIDISTAGAITNAAGIVSTGDIDFGGADLELPQGQTPDTDGDVDLDFTDGSLVIQHGSAHAELAGATDVVMGKLIKSFSATIFAPDGVNDVIPVKPIVAGEFPHGVVITEIHMVVGTDTNYTIDVENWDDFDTISAGNPSINSTAYVSGNNGEVTDSAITFAAIAAGQIIMIDIPATDIDWVSITIYYYEPIS